MGSREADVSTERGVADDEGEAVVGGGDADEAVADADDGELAGGGGRWEEERGVGVGEAVGVVAVEGVADVGAVVAELEEEEAGGVTKVERDEGRVGDEVAP